MNLHVDELPDCTMLKVFSFLTLRELCSIQTVCKRWHKLLQDFSLWSDISVIHDSHLASILSEEMLSIWLARWDRHVRNLRLRYCRKLTNFTGQLIGNHCLQITGIDLQGCVGIGDYGIALIAERCTMLKRANLFMTGITDVGCTDLVRKVPTIRALKLPNKGNCYRSLDSICSNCECLDALVLNDVIPFDETDPVVNDAIIKVFAATYTSIQKISLNWCWYITDESITAIAKTCVNLCHLVIRECHQVTDCGISSVIRMCPKLKKLQIGRLYGVTDDLAEAFVGRRTSLQRLKLLDTSITDKGIAKILEGSPNMLGVFVGEYCFNGSNIGGELILSCTKHCRRLEELVLISCKNVKDKMLLGIAEHLAGLKTLCLSSCVDVTKIGLRCILENLRKLRVLRICKCNEFDDAILAEAATRLTVLIVIELYGCKKITAEGIKNFQMIRPNCNVRI